MTGYRSGFVAGDPTLIGALRRLRPARRRHAPGVRAAREHRRLGRRATRRGEPRRYAAKRAVFLDLFERRGIRVAGSEGTFYLWVAVPGDRQSLDVGVPAPRAGRRRGRAGSFFGPEGEGYVRMAMVPTMEECERAARSLDRPCTRCRRERRPGRADRAHMVGRVADDPSAPIDAEAVDAAIDLLDRGEIRVAEPSGNNGCRGRSTRGSSRPSCCTSASADSRRPRSGPFEYHDKAAAEAGLRGGRRPCGAARDRALRRPHRAGRRADAELRQHRRLGRRSDDGGHVGDGRLVRADRRRRASRGGRGDRRRAGAGPGRAGGDRGRRLRRIALRRRRGRACRAPGRCSARVSC